MKKNILLFSEFANNSDEMMNEGIISTVSDWFTSLFNWFKNKKVKDEIESTSQYLQSIQDNVDIDDTEIDEEIDVKRLRGSYKKVNKLFSNQLQVENEIVQKTNSQLIDQVTSWFSELLASEEMTNIPMIQTMLKNSMLSKRFTWVPLEFRGKTMKWYAQSECKLDPVVADSLKKIVLSEPANKIQAIRVFCKQYIFIICKKTKDGSKKYSSNDQEFLEDLQNGFCEMFSNINKTTLLLYDKTPDERVKEIVSKVIIKKRTASPKKNVNKKATNAEGETSPSRTRRAAKKITIA